MKKNELPNNICEHIQNGQTVFLDGYIQLLSEETIADLSDCLCKISIWQGGIPFAVTAFSDIFVWNDGYIYMYDLINNDYNVIMSEADFFFNNIEDIEYQKEYFDIDLFYKAKSKIGTISYGECYSIVPIPALGGEKNIKYMHIDKIKEYIMLLCS